MSVRYYLCWFVLPIALTSCASAYLTSLVCRLARWRHRVVRWYFALVGAVGASIVAILFICLGLFLPRGAMSGFDSVGFLGSIFIWVTAFAVVPGLLVTRFYRRKKYGDAEHVEYQCAANGGGPSQLQSPRLVAAVAELGSLAVIHAHGAF